MAGPPPIPVHQLTRQELRALYDAKQLLENPSLAARLANRLGAPIEKGFQMLPPGWTEAVQRASRKALFKALQAAVATLDPKPRRRRTADRLHKLLVGTTGGIGGAFGLAALPIELPISTTLMLRSIAEIARSEGHDLRSMEVRLECLEVFALGGPKPEDDAVESSYWAVRAALAKLVSEAAGFLVQRGLVDTSAPTLVRLVAAIAARFGVVVSEQLAAKAVPVLGAAAGSAVNVLFLDHFQNMARGHFIVRRLEAKYGPALVKAVYDSLAVPIGHPPSSQATRLGGG